jgi:Fungal Zn(2)-Cys(6) binuclear cluster domain
MYADDGPSSGTACWPCRQRKVKCDNKQPCENCVKRDHAQLCSYKPKRSSTGNAGSVSSDSSHHKKRAHSPDADVDTKPEPRQGSWPRAIGKIRLYRDSLHQLHRCLIDLSPANVDDSEAAEVSRFVGQNSIPALLREQSSGNELGESDIRQDMRSILGLDTSAPFPLMSPQHLDRMTKDIAAELPSDREVMKYAEYTRRTMAS